MHDQSYLSRQVPVNLPRKRVPTAGRFRSALNRVQERPRAQNPDLAERVQLKEVRVPSYDGSRVGSEGALQNPIISLVLENRVNSSRGFCLFGELSNRRQRVTRPTRRPAEFPLQDAIDLVEYRFRHEHFDPSSPRQRKYLVGHPAEIERGNVYVRVRYDPEHSALSPVFSDQPLDIRF